LYGNVLSDLMSYLDSS